MHSQEEYKNNFKILLLLDTASGKTRLNTDLLKILGTKNMTPQWELS
jgi:hypothetical protein